MDVFSLFSFRQKKQRGEVPDVFQYTTLPHELRVQIVQTWRAAIGRNRPNDAQRIPHSRQYPSGTVYVPAVELIRQARGKFALNEKGVTTRDVEIELAEYVLNEDDVELVLDAVEAIFGLALEKFGDWERPFWGGDATATSVSEGVTRLNKWFRLHGVGFEMNSGRIIRVDSQFLHATAVKPALTLLQSKKLAGANKEFLRAHDHYRHGRHEAALTDALKAFESTMKAIAVAKGWTLVADSGKQVKEDKATAKVLINTMLQNNLVPAFSREQLTGTRLLLESALPTTRNKLAGHGSGVNPRTLDAATALFGLQAAAANILLLAGSAGLSK